MKAYGMDVYSRWMLFFLFQLCHCENTRKLLRQKRSASALNNPQYQIIPRVQRMNYWQDDSYEDFNSYEDALEKGWLDGDFGLRSPATVYKQKIFGPHKQNRRQRNIKVNIRLQWQDCLIIQMTQINSSLFYFSCCHDITHYCVRYSQWWWGIYIEQPSPNLWDTKT